MLHRKVHQKLTRVYVFWYNDGWSLWMVWSKSLLDSIQAEYVCYLHIITISIIKIDPSLTVGWLSVGAVWICNSPIVFVQPLQKKWYYIIHIVITIILLYKFDDLALGLYKYFDSVRAFIVFVYSLCSSWSIIS